MAEKKPDASDIVERLRCNYDGRDFSGPMQVVLPTAIMLEAAELIENLRKELQSTKVALDATMDTSVKLLSAEACEKHQEWIKRITFGEFAQSLQEMGCQWCMREELLKLRTQIDGMNDE